MKNLNNDFDVIIFHGTGGRPEGNWFPWLAEQLKMSGYRAQIPRFPTPEGQNLESWTSVFHEQIGNLGPNMVLVGHSLGPGFILNLLEKSSSPVYATFLVAGFTGKLGIDDFDLLNETFVCRAFDWKKIRDNAGVVKIYNSDNDPYVSLKKGEDLARNLHSKLTVVQNGGHMNADSGYFTFPTLLKDICNVLDPESKL